MPRPTHVTAPLLATNARGRGSEATIKEHLLSGASDSKAPWAGIKAPDFAGWKASSGYSFAGSGNAAFDEYKREQLKRLDEERRKLEEEQHAFRDFVEKVRRAKDQDEFNRFMSERRSMTEQGPGQV